MNYLTPLYDKLLESHINIVPDREGYYLTKISIGECLICYDYIWNGPFRDVCKHNHAAKIYQQSQMNNLLYQQQVKADLVNYFKNKHRVLPAEKKNELIYNGDVETAFEEIVKIFEIQGKLLLSYLLIVKLLIYFTIVKVEQFFKLIEYNRILIMILFAQSCQIIMEQQALEHRLNLQQSHENLQEFFEQFNKILKKQAHLHLKNESPKE